MPPPPRSDGTEPATNSGDEHQRLNEHAAETGYRPRRIVIERVYVGRHLWLDGLIVLLMGGILALVWRAEPSPSFTGTHQQWGFPPCTFRALLDLPCPGCGVTTGLALMVRGRVSDAFLANMLAPVLFAIGAWLGVNSALALLTRRRIALRLPRHWHGRIGLLGALYLLLAWAVKIATYKVMEGGA